jgi:tRNA threonylcarbamoyladenosine modification (KEOPS) complex  Pcc1 subunit
MGKLVGYHKVHLAHNNKFMEITGIGININKTSIMVKIIAKDVANSQNCIENTNEKEYL